MQNTYLQTNAEIINPRKESPREKNLKSWKMYSTLNFKKLFIHIILVLKMKYEEHGNEKTEGVKLNSRDVELGWEARTSKSKSQILSITEHCSPSQIALNLFICLLSSSCYFTC